MRISQAGLDAIKKHEGLRLNAYPDPASGGDPWTIGYGHTRGVEPGQTITKAQAEQFLREDLAWVETCIERNVVAPLTQGQYDALCSLIFNIGQAAFTKSTLMRLLNQRDYAGASAQFERWNIAAGQVHLGLTNRRAAERAMFLSDAPALPEPTPAGDPAQPTQEGGMPIPAIVAALLPAVIESIPKLGAIFKGSGSEVAQRNMEAATTVLDIVQKATNTPNAQAAVEAIQASPAAKEAAQAAIEERWYQLTEAGGGGIAAARKADQAVMSSDGPWWQVVRSPSFLFLLLVMPTVYAIVGSIVGLWGTEWPSDVRAAIATAVVSLVVGGAAGYYWGQTTSRNRTAP